MQSGTFDTVDKKNKKPRAGLQGPKGHRSERELCNASCFSWYRMVMPLPLLSLCASSKTSQWHRCRSNCGAQRPVTPECSTSESRDGGEQSGSGEFRGCGTTAYMLESVKLTKLEEEISWSR